MKTHLIFKEFSRTQNGFLAFLSIFYPSFFGMFSYFLLKVQKKYVHQSGAWLIHYTYTWIICSALYKKSFLFIQRWKNNSSGIGYTELVLFLILTFDGSSIRNFLASPLTVATVWELVLFKSSYISIIEPIRYVAKRYSYNWIVFSEQIVYPLLIRQ